jgi:hypothetical protein
MTLKPHCVKGFNVSNDPNFAGKLEAIVRLYLNLPEHVNLSPDCSL